MNERRPRPSVVLIVEDEDALREVTAALLGDVGYVVLQARDGADALAQATKTPPDLVLTDLMMPVCTGHELIQALRADERLRHIPTIVMTAGAPTLAEGLGAAALLRKPFTCDALLATIAAVLEQARARALAEGR